VSDNTPPALRTHLGRDFTEANSGCALSLQYCAACGCVQYPPRELCQQCLQGELQWRETNTRGILLSRVALHHSISSYFNQKIAEAGWPIGSVKLDCGAIVYAHLALQTFDVENIEELCPGEAVEVFSHTDSSGHAVLVAASVNTAVANPQQRRSILEQMALCGP
jgi:uncharacterized OB-fold protein